MTDSALPSAALLAPRLQALRRQLRSARRALTNAQQQRAQQKLLYRVRMLPWFTTARRLGFYVASDGELNPAALLVYSLLNARRCFLPVLSKCSGEAMHFAPYGGRAALAPRHFGIRAPAAPGLAGWRMDVVFAPVVGFDRSGARLGRGGGYYDRAFAARVGRPRPLLVGIAHPFQEVAQLPQRDHDVRLDIIVTPDEVIEVQRDTRRNAHQDAHE